MRNFFFLFFFSFPFPFQVVSNADKEGKELGAFLFFFSPLLPLRLWAEPTTITFTLTAGLSFFSLTLFLSFPRALQAVVAVTAETLFLFLPLPGEHHNAASLPPFSFPFPFPPSPWPWAGPGNNVARITFPSSSGKEKKKRTSSPLLLPEAGERAKNKGNKERSLFFLSEIAVPQRERRKVVSPFSYDSIS